jgi:hypothetical protein
MNRRYEDRPELRAWKIWLMRWDTVIMLLIVLASMGTVAYVVDHVETDTDAELLRIEEANEASNRATAYRLCSRNSVDRSYAHARERGLSIKGLPKPRPMSADERQARRRASRALMSVGLLPILDCRPNLRGRGARWQPIATQERVMHEWRTGQLSNEELGICPESVIGEQGSARDC